MKKNFFRRSRIYVLPTKMGGYLNGLIFLMFLLSVGYSNNLLLIFTLFLFGFNLIWLVQTHYHLKAMVFNNVFLEDGHVGENCKLTVHWKSRPQGSIECELSLLSGERELKASPIVQEQNVSQGNLRIEQRGLWHWDTLKIQTDRPFGLYRAWIYWPINIKSYAWPSLVKQTPPLTLDPGSLEGEVPTEKRGQGDMKGLLPYSNDEVRHISWKHYARTGELLIKEGEEIRTPTAHFHWDDLDVVHKEEHLSKLATALVHCHRQDIPFTLKLPGKLHGPDSGRSHLISCLKDLSLC